MDSIDRLLERLHIAKLDDDPVAKYEWTDMLEALCEALSELEDRIRTLEADRLEFHGRG